jgi:hypothetical protein
MKKETGVATWRWRIAKAGLNASKFCKVSGAVDRSTLSKFMTGKVVPYPEISATIEAALKKLGV